MSDLRKAAEMALEALNLVMSHGQAVQRAKDVLRQALEQPEWVGLTDEEIEECKINGGLPHAINWRLSVKVMEAKLKEKNT